MTIYVLFEPLLQRYSGGQNKNSKLKFFETTVKNVKKTVFVFFKDKRSVYGKKCINEKSFVLLWYIHNKNFNPLT